MNEGRDDVGYWTGWIAAFVLLAIFFLIALFVGWFSPPYCQEAENGAVCLRTWIEALGGWTTIPAAGVGAWFVVRQIKVAGQHHRESAFIDLQRSRALVLRASMASTEVLSMSVVFGNYWEQLSTEIVPISQLEADFQRHTEDLWERLSDNVFDDVEGDTLAPSTSISAVRRKIKRMTKPHPLNPGEISVSPFVLMEKMKRICEIIRDYDRDIQVETKRFVETARHILGG